MKPIMEPRTLEYVVECLAAADFRGDPRVVIQRVCTDSRKLQPGDLFIALRGERFDGHEFLMKAAELGAGAVICERVPEGFPAKGCGLIRVPDSRRALAELAARYRSDFDLPIVVVGGSNGKTTTKELVAAVLRQRFHALASEASFNNDIGVPLTLLELDRSHQAAVLEIGTNHPGEIASLMRLVRPRYGVTTSIGAEHLEFFHDLNGVAEEEGWLPQLLPVNGRFFVNGDDPWSDRLGRRTSAGVSRVGLGPVNQWRAEAVQVDAAGTAFRLEAPDEKLAGDYRVNLLGRHQVTNALLALAVGGELGLGRTELQRGLAACAGVKMRLQLFEAEGVTVINDAYNANLDSTRAALQTLRDLPCGGRRVAVLGDMAELGEQTAAAHREVGRLAAAAGLDQLFTVGAMAGETAEAARAAGLADVTPIESVEIAVEAVKGFARSGDLILVKASRAARLERVADAFRAVAVGGAAT